MRALLPAALVVFVALGCANPPCTEQYGSCDELQSCPHGSSCGFLEWEYGSGDICMRSCRSQLDCPRDDGRPALCLDVAHEGRFACYPTCGTAFSTCPAGWVCQPTTSGAVCLP